MKNRRGFDSFNTRQFTRQNIMFNNVLHAEYNLEPLKVFHFHPTATAEAVTKTGQTIIQQLMAQLSYSTTTWIAVRRFKSSKMRYHGQLRQRRV